MRIYLFLLSVLFLSCNNEVEVIEFNIKRSATFTFPQVREVSSIPEAAVIQQSIAKDSAFTKRNLGVDDISSTQLTDLKLEVIDPEDRDLGFLREVEIYLQYPDGEEALLAENENINNNVGRSLELAILLTELDDVAKAEEYGLRISTLSDETTSSKTDLRLSYTWEINARQED